MTAMTTARRPSAFDRVRRAASMLGGYLGLAIVVAVVIVMVALGILPARRWAPFSDIRVWQFLWQGLLVTLQIGAVSLVASLALSLPLALARLNLSGPLRWIVVVWVELVRATPVLALILFTILFMPRTGIDIAPVWAATLGLTIYTSAVVSEIVRAGIVSIPVGEVHAARSLGLSYVQTMRLVVLPQAISRMMPAIVSQCITLVKDTSLASIAAVSELVGYARSSFVFFGNAAETLFVVACIFFVINYTLSRIARRLELRRPEQERVQVPVELQAEGDPVVKR
jgi:His/Glu/Gln/Arg/opine family amino acid ABC transporter permease subunit